MGGKFFQADLILHVPHIGGTGWFLFLFFTRWWLLLIFQYCFEILKYDAFSKDCSVGLILAVKLKKKNYGFESEGNVSNLGWGQRQVRLIKLERDGCNVN